MHPLFLPSAFALSSTAHTPEIDAYLETCYVMKAPKRNSLSIIKSEI